MKDAPCVVPMDHLDARSSHLVAVSGKSKLSVQKNIEALVAFINDNSELSLPSLAYKSTTRRMYHNHRVIVSGHDLGSIRDAPQGLGSCEDLKPIPNSAKVPDVGFVFTGQSVPYAGLARQLFENISQHRADLPRFDDTAKSQGFPRFLPLIDGTKNRLNEVGPAISQLCTACVQKALAQLWISLGVCPSAVIGHSLGEYVALHTVVVVLASDPIFLVGIKAQLLENAAVPERTLCSFSKPLCRRSAFIWL